jgi:hypothetical protein
MAIWRKIFVVAAIGILILCNGKVAKDFIASKNEHHRLLAKMNFLLEKNEELGNAFVLKQDHMRKMLTDRDFIEQVICQKEGYIKPTGTILKFED